MDSDGSDCGGPGEYDDGADVADEGMDSAADDEEEASGEEAEEDGVGEDASDGDEAPAPGPCATQDVLLPFELARLEGMEAVRIERGADLVHGDTRGETRAMQLALRYVNARDPRRRSPWVLVREGRAARSSRPPARIALREARIAGPLSRYLPSPSDTSSGDDEDAR